MNLTADTRATTEALRAMYHDTDGLAAFVLRHGGPDIARSIRWGAPFDAVCARVVAALDIHGLAGIVSDAFVIERTTGPRAGRITAEGHLYLDTPENTRVTYWLRAFNGTLVLSDVRQADGSGRCAPFCSLDFVDTACDLMPPEPEPMADTVPRADYDALAEKLDAATNLAAQRGAIIREAREAAGCSDGVNLGDRIRTLREGPKTAWRAAVERIHDATFPGDDQPRRTVAEIVMEIEALRQTRDSLAGLTTGGDQEALRQKLAGMMQEASTIGATIQAIRALRAERDAVIAERANLREKLARSERTSEHRLTSLRDLRQAAGCPHDMPTAEALEHVRRLREGPTHSDDLPPDWRHACALIARAAFPADTQPTRTADEIVAAVGALRVERDAAQREAAELRTAIPGAIDHRCAFLNERDTARAEASALREGTRVARLAAGCADGQHLTDRVRELTEERDAARAASADWRAIVEAASEAIGCRPGQRLDERVRELRAVFDASTAKATS